MSEHDFQNSNKQLNRDFSLENHPYPNKLFDLNKALEEVAQIMYSCFCQLTNKNQVDSAFNINLLLGAEKNV